MNWAVEFRNVSKTFPGYGASILANDQINLKIKTGSIHAIIGENGAGKSTAMKMLYGIYSADSGEIWIDGQPWGGQPGGRWSSPRHAIACGIGMVHQHFMLAGPYTVLENVTLGIESSLKFWNWLPRCVRPIDQKSPQKKLQKISEQYGLKLDGKSRVEGLSVGIQQRIEIVKLLYKDAKILILDEPTAVLTPQETEELFLQLKKLAKEGKTILIVTHKLKEVLSLADEVTVFRTGKVVAHRKVQETSSEELATLMVGRKVNLPRVDLNRNRSKKGRTPVLEMEGVLKKINLVVYAGETVGIAGVEGNGQSELLQFLTQPKDFFPSGRLRVLGKEASHYSAHLMKKNGVALIPENRQTEGLLLKSSVAENFILGLQSHPNFKKRGFLSHSAAVSATQKAINEYDIRPRLMEVPVASLSGGNQQKIIIAREFYRKPKLLIAAQPTRGVDIGAIEFIHRKILEACNEGMGVLLISSELDEILALSDRIVVMFEGKITAEFARGEADESRLGLKMTGAAAP